MHASITFTGIKTHQIIESYRRYTTGHRTERQDNFMSFPVKLNCRLTATCIFLQLKKSNLPHFTYLEMLGSLYDKHTAVLRRLRREAEESSLILKKELIQNLKRLNQRWATCDPRKITVRLAEWCWKHAILILRRRLGCWAENVQF